MNWDRKTLGEIYVIEGGTVQTGPFGSQLHEADYTNFGVPVIMPKDIVNDKLDLSTIAYISEDDAKRLSQHIVKKNDIVCPRRGEIGKRIIVEDSNVGAFCGTGCIRLRGTGAILNPLYLFYFLKQPKIVKWIENQAIGSTMMNLNTSILKSIPVKYPALPTQQKIASILSAYDELIENNNQRIKHLESMAEELYKEWFVRLRFPGFESVEMVDGLPMGWSKVKVEDAFEIIGGGTPFTENITFWENGQINWFSPTDITASNNIFLDKSSKKITDLGLKSSSARLFPAKSVMVTSRATIGAVGINLTEACTNQGFITCIPNKHFSYQYIYEWIKCNKELLNNHSSGATFKEISKSVFKKFEIIKIELNILNQYTEIVTPMFDEIQLLGSKNALLQQTRDVLLPRLISGKLEV